MVHSMHFGVERRFRFLRQPMRIRWNVLNNICFRSKRTLFYKGCLIEVQRSENLRKNSICSPVQFLTVHPTQSKLNFSHVSAHVIGVNSIIHSFIQTISIAPFQVHYY